MTPLIIPLPGNVAMAAALAGRLDAELGRLETRRFPDQELYLRLPVDVAGRSVTFVCTLDRPNEKLMQLLFAAATARELGAASVGLVAPYLAYLRQDARFQPGEAVTSRPVAKLLSEAFDWLATVDPHLHRFKSLAEIYRIPCRVVSAAPLMARWIGDNVPDAVVIGPDSESRQWVSAVAGASGFPFTVLTKRRRGDRDVSIEVKQPSVLAGRQPVLVDDIISSGRTMLEAVRVVRAMTGRAPVCMAVHGIFADRADDALARAGARVITCNTIPQATAALDVAPLIAAALQSS
jgi:ribose-phosphate pyrophosphokinase